MNGSNSWLVTFRYLDDERTVHCFYVVRDAADPDSAQRMAAVEAASPLDLLSRAFHPLDQSWLQVERLQPNLLGEWVLTPA
ncbi:hypothetical protein [Streptomyces sp. NPDC057199]|uniref:hypothetical protein n=1 Tax=Streptomyces sp. NPDC057199 TaxID=3346047 RepID=UPI003630C082